MMLNPIIAMLHNTAANRWHPIVFREHPLPGPPSADKPVRHKSAGHHTDGFALREDALAWIEENKNKLEGVRLCVEKAFEWDGKDIPAMVVFFAENDGQLVPAL